MYMNDLFKQLISQEVDSNGIRFISFKLTQIPQYKSQDEIKIIRPINELQGYNIGDFVKTQWGRVYKIDDLQLYANFQDYPYLNELSKEQINYLNENNSSFKYLKLVKVIKKEVKRYFFDTIYDDSRMIYGARAIIPIAISIIDEQGNELSVFNKNYKWELAPAYLNKNAKTFFINSSDFQKMSPTAISKKIVQFMNPSPEIDIKLYGYYSDTDYVVLSQIFGQRNNFPKYFPKYSLDLKQTLDYFKQNLQSIGLNQKRNKYDIQYNAKFYKKIYEKIVEKYNPQGI